MKEANFKETEIGKIPVDWEVDYLGNVSQIIGRIGFRGYTVNDIVDQGNGAITISPSNIFNSKVSFSKCTYLSWFKYEQSPEIKIYNGDILLVKTGSTVGKTAIVKGLNEKATLNPQVVVLKNIMINNFYLSYLMSFENIQNQLTAVAVGGAIPTLSQKQVEKFQIPLPPLAEQEKIAEVLIDTDLWIESTEALLAKKRLLKKGAMQKLLSPKEDWEVRKLGEVFKLKQGVQCEIEAQFRIYKSGLKRFIRIVDLTQKNIELRYILDPGKEHHICETDLFMVRYGAPGFVGYNFNGVIANNLFRLIPKFEINSKYFKFLFEFMKSDFEEMSTSSTMAALNFTTLNKVDLFFPNIFEQQKIAEILSSMDLEIESLENRLQKARNIKQGMMQDLLTGKVRLG